MALLSPQLGARVVDAVPEAFRPSWLRETWSGSFGARGLVAQVDDASSTVRLGIDSLAGDGMATGDVLELAGMGLDDAVVGGGFKRVTTLDTHGRLVVGHEKLKLEEAFQRSGFGRAFNDHAFARYEAAGVDAVRVSADLEVGGYAWARQGFELLAEGMTGSAADVSRGRRLAQFATKALELGQITESEFAQLAPRLVGMDRRLPPDAITSVRQLADMPMGRGVLLGSAWQGERLIDHSRPDLAARAIADLSRALPDALVPAAIRDVLDTRVGARLSSSATTTLGLRGADEIGHASTSLAITLPDGRFGMAGIAVDDGRPIVTEKFPVADPALRADLDAAWHDLGIDEVRNTFA